VAEGRDQIDKPTAIVVGVGAEQGIGGAVCRRFASEVYHVHVAGRTEAKIAMMNDQMNKVLRGTRCAATARITVVSVVLPRIRLRRRCLTG
jgi:NADP-dependent 3-hydroxy acid dehydrogenase YdfG